MKTFLFSLVFTAFLILSAVFLLNNSVDDLFTEEADYTQTAFTDEEIHMLNDYSSELYRNLGSTDNPELAKRFFSYFDIPDSVKKDYEFTFYLLEFRHLRELHAFGQSSDNNDSYVVARILDERIPGS